MLSYKGYQALKTKREMIGKKEGKYNKQKLVKKFLGMMPNKILVNFCQKLQD